MFLLNKRSIGNISSLPVSIKKINTSLELVANIEKLPAGPIFESPRPILLNVSSTLDIVVSKSKFSNDT